MLLSSLCRVLLAALFAASCAASFAADATKLTLSIQAGKHDRENVPVRVAIQLPAALKDATVAKVNSPDGKTYPAQVTTPRLLAKVEELLADKVARELCFVLPSLKAGQSVDLSATIPAEAADSNTKNFHWQNTPGDYADLQHGDRPVLRYMYKALDESKPEKRVETYKVFHHVYDPTGKAIVTKGAGGTFTHHRGLFFGFNRVTYGDNKTCDVWHCSKDAYQSHDNFVSTDVGPVLGRHLLEVGWHGQNKELFATEQRELTAYAVPGGTLIEFASRVRTTGGPVKLNGDPQHAGFHFRASQEVADKAKKVKETYYVRPDGIGKPGETRNWDAKHPTEINFPWKAMSFVVGDQRYTVANLDRPTNPKDARFSERDYGRFGSYFEYEITAEKPLEVNYRIWLQQGEMTQDQVARLANDFVEPVVVEVK